MKRFLSLFLAFLPLLAIGQADQKLITQAENGNTQAMVKLAWCYEKGAGVPQDSSTALQWYQRAAEKGSGDAWTHISNYYLHGTLMPKDTSQFLEINREWAQKGNGNAMTKLAIAYLSGIGIQCDTTKAFEWLKKAEKKGSPEAFLILGDACFWKVFKDIDPDEKKAVSYWKKALKGGETMAAVRLCDYYYSKDDYDASITSLQEGLKWNDPLCRTTLAEIYFYGRIYEMDEAKAIKIVKDVVDNNKRLQYPHSVAGHFFMVADNPDLRDSTLAMHYWKEGSNMGSNLCNWNLVGYLSSIEEYSEALGFLLKIVRNNNDNDYKPEACYDLSRRYYQGLGCNADKDSVRYWLQRGSDEFNNSECAMTLAALYEQDYFNDNQDNAAMTVKYYTKAYNLGYEEALDELARFYSENGMSEKSMDCYQTMIDNGDMEGYYKKAVTLAELNFEEQARKTLETGDKKGCRDCSATLGRMSERNDPPDYKKAEKYYLKSATAWSYYRLALLYLNGDLGKSADKDIQKGLDYLHQSCDMGQVDAYLALAYCYETGTAVGNIDYTKAMQCYETLTNYDVPVGYFKLAQYYENGVGNLQVDSIKALELYQTAADKGYGEAMCYLGDFYRIGQFVDKDPQQAFKYYSMADEAGEEIGTYYIGRSFLEGCGVPIDTLAALPYLRNAANRGIGRAAYLLGSFYDYAKGGLPNDPDSALYYYLSGHENGNGDASYHVGVKLIREEAYEQALQYIYSGAQRGNIDALVMLALFIQEGIAIDADPQQAYQLFELAANNAHDPRAYMYMGKARLQGNGCKQNETLGKLYLDTAASMGNVQAMYLLGLCYLQGYGCTADSTIAIEWLNRASDNGNANAVNLMGDLYEQQEDYENALRYYQLGYDLGNIESCCNLAYCYEKGQGVILNIKKAIELYTEAANAGSSRAMKMLAQCYLDNVAGDPDPDKAVEWLSKAADIGDAQAMFMLASLYEEGDTDEYRFPKDLKKAKSWYQKSAAAGFEPAQAALNRLK